MTSTGGAAAALRDQIFTPTFALYDDNPELTSGCGSIFLCRINIVFGFDSAKNAGFVTAYENINQETSDKLYTGSNYNGFYLLNPLTDTSGDNFENFARFTRVDKPTTAAIFGIGLAGLASLRRRRRPG